MAAADADAEMDQMEIRQSTLPGKAFLVLQQLRQDNYFHDVKLIVGKETIGAHRVVLAATIPYFYSMFTLEMKEATLDEIALNEVDAEALALIIDFAYSGRIIVNIENVQRIMLVASFLQINKIRDGCAEFLKKRVSAENVIGIRNFVEALNCPCLVSYADKYIEKNFYRMTLSDEFLQIGLVELIDLLSKDELCIESEEEVYKAMIRWIQEDTELRAVHLPQLLKTIRLPLVTPEFLADVVAVEPLIRSSFECRDLLDEVRNFFLIPERRHLFSTFKTKARCGDEIGYIYVVGSITRPGITNCPHHDTMYCTCITCDSMSTVEFFDPIQQKWKMAESMKMLRSRVGVCFVKRRLYAVGGFNGMERLNTLEAYDPIAKVWDKASPMSFSRSAVGCCALLNKLYVCGGYDGTSSLNQVECYNPDTDEWKTVTPMLKHRSAAGVVTLNGHIYCIGGHDGLSIFNSVEKYDPYEGTWTFVAPMKTNRCRLGAAALNGKLYTCGGYNGSTFLATMESYDPATDSWQDVAPMNQMRSRVVLVSNGGKLYAIGGYDGICNLSTVEVYNPVSDAWTLIPSMFHQGGVGAAAVMSMETWIPPTVEPTLHDRLTKPNSKAI